MEASATSQDAPSTGEILEDASPSGNGGSRRPGNVWTVEAREDVFNRREVGEGWETICPDYPNRSRHAMQQQYSIMKKQRAVANGTWISNRRGRKRKMTAAERWTSVNQQRRGWDEPEEEEDSQDEDFEVAGLEETEGLEEKDSNYLFPQEVESLRGFRPPLPTRSATDPVAQAPKSKIITFPHHARSAGLLNPAIATQHDAADSSKTSTDNEWSALNLSQPPYANKRQRVSPDVAGKPDTTPAPFIPLYSSFPAIMLEEAEIQELLERARNRSQNVSLFHDIENKSQREAFESGVSRSNRRINDIEERLRNLGYEHADDMKVKQQQHTEEILALRRGSEREQKSRSDSYKKKTDALKRIIESLRQEREDKERSFAQEIESMRNELQKALIPLTPTDNASDTIIFSAGLKAQLDVRDEELKRSERYCKGITQKLTSLKSLHKNTKWPVLQTISKHSKMAGTLDRLKDGLEDLSMKAISRALGEMVQEKSETEQWLLQATESLDNLAEAFDAIANDVPAESIPIISTPNLDAGRVELHRTLTNGTHDDHTLEATNGASPGPVVLVATNSTVNHITSFMEPGQDTSHGASSPATGATG